MQTRQSAPQAGSVRQSCQGGPRAGTGWWQIECHQRPNARPRPMKHASDPNLEIIIMENPDQLLTPGEVALMFRVDPKTVTRWASAGRIGSIRTPGGHRRFRESEIRGLLADLTVHSSLSTA